MPSPTLSIPGVDLSHHNAPVDFGLLKAAGKRWVALKATDGAGYTDPTFAERRPRAQAVGFEHLLLYHFFRPEAPVLQQVARLRTAVGALAPNERIVLDIEAAVRSGSDTWRAFGPSGSAMLVEAFVSHAKEAFGIGAAAFVLYGSLGWLRGQFGAHLRELTFMDLWDARYRPLAEGPGDTSPWPPVGDDSDRAQAIAWQWSETGSAPGGGAPGTLDLDVWIGARAWA